jgi:hypothetical protein
MYRPDVYSVVKRYTDLAIPWQVGPEFKVLFRHLPGGTKENHVNLSQDSRSQGLDFNSETSQIRSMSVIHSTTMFGDFGDSKHL